MRRGGMDDRRKSSRAQSIFDLQVVDTDRLKVIGTLENVSTRGIGVIGEERVTLRKVYQLELIVPLEEGLAERIGFTAKCVWRRADPDAVSYHSGFRFVDVPARDMQALERLLGDGFLLAR
jgi:c-di-GMP-binding flagellar brake protein YcgR